jgi:hypothetical protein
MNNKTMSKRKNKLKNVNKLYIYSRIEITILAINEINLYNSTFSRN